MTLYKITSLSYQPIKDCINGKTFVIPQKPYSVTISLKEIPESLKELAQKNIITIKEVNK